MLVCDIYTVFRRFANTWAAPSESVFEYAHNGQIQINTAHAQSLIWEFVVY